MRRSAPQELPHGLALASPTLSGPVLQGIESADVDSRYSSGRDAIDSVITDKALLEIE